MGNKPSNNLEEFLNFVRDTKNEYLVVFDNVGKEDKRLQDLLHEIEFSENEKDKRKAATKLRSSRKERRKNKDRVKELEKIVDFFEDKQHKAVLNQLQQLLGAQRKIESFLDGERTYKQRVPEDGK